MSNTYMYNTARTFHPSWWDTTTQRSSHSLLNNIFGRVYSDKKKKKMPWLQNSISESVIFVIGEGNGHPTPIFLPEKPPWTEEPGRLQSLGSQRIKHNLVTEPHL